MNLRILASVSASSRTTILLNVLLASGLSGWAVVPGAAASGRQPSAATSFSGARALAHVEKIVSYGPRPSGSEALRKTQQYILSRLRDLHLEVEEDDFIARAPQGPVPMKNIIARIPGRRPDVLLLATHYESKQLPGFVGANDGGSSTGLMLELARVLTQQKNAFTIWIVFFDGEEPFQNWSQTDGLYGSRHLAARLKATGKLARIHAMVLADMIGDRDLGVFRDDSSTGWLLDLFSEAAGRLGYSRFFFQKSTAVVDDHTPFLEAGVPSIDLIDFEYGPGNRYWHTSQDTLDKLSPRSLEIVGRVILEAIRLLSSKMGL